MRKLKLQGALPVVLLLTALPFAILPTLAAPEPGGRELLRKIDDMWRGESSAVLMTMQIKTAHFERKLKMKGYSKGKDLTLMRITYPKQEAGTATLKVDNNIWNYLPRTRRVMKIPSSMMMGSWMGSHFTNDDLVRESRLEDDYDFELVVLDNADGVPIYQVTLLPKPDAPVVWGKITLDIRRDNLVPLVQDYFDEDLKLVRRATFSNVQKLEDRTIPLTMKMVPIDKPEEFTEIIYEKLLFDIDLDDRFFSIQNLKKR
jgi:hypothetical protein